MSGYSMPLGAYSSNHHVNHNHPHGSSASSSSLLLSSLLSSSFNSNPNPDDVRRDHLDHSGSLLTRSGSMNEDDGDSSELLRGMLDDILRPASPPIMDRLFSAKNISNANSNSGQTNNNHNPAPALASASSSLFSNHSNSTHGTNTHLSNQLFFSSASVEDIISDLSPNAPVFQPNPLPLPLHHSSSLHQQFLSSSLSNTLLNDDYWTFPGMDSASTGDLNYASHANYHLTSQIDDFLADTLTFAEPSSPPAHPNPNPPHLFPSQQR